MLRLYYPRIEKKQLLITTLADNSKYSKYMTDNKFYQLLNSLYSWI